MAAKLAGALGEAGGAAGPAAPGAGSALRIEARLATGAALTAVVRIAGLADRPLAIHRWDYRADCP